MLPVSTQHTIHFSYLSIVLFVCPSIGCSLSIPNRTRFGLVFVRICPETTVRFFWIRGESLVFPIVILFVTNLVIKHRILNFSMFSATVFSNHGFGTCRLQISPGDICISVLSYLNICIKEARCERINEWNRFIPMLIISLFFCQKGSFIIHILIDYTHLIIPSNSLFAKGNHQCTFESSLQFGILID